MTTKELGDLGEKLACEYLVKKGFTILGLNYKIRFGEIDIVARSKKTIHIIEVKALRAYDRESDFFPEQHVDFKKRRKLQHMARIWLEKHKYRQDQPYQIDIIGISFNETTRMAKLHYFPNAVGE